MPGVSSPSHFCLPRLMSQTQRCGEWCLHTARKVLGQLGRNVLSTLFFFQFASVRKNKEECLTLVLLCFLVNRIGEGRAHLCFLHRNECYEMTWPNVDIKGIILGKLRMEMSGPVRIECQQTGYIAELEFSNKVSCSFVLFVLSLSLSLPFVFFYRSSVSSGLLHGRAKQHHWQD